MGGRSVVPAERELEAVLQQLLDEAASEIFRMDGLATDDRLGRLVVRVRPVESLFEYGVFQGPTMLFHENATADAIQALRAGDLEEVFVRHRAEINDRAITAQMKWIQREVLPEVEEQVIRLLSPRVGSGVAEGLRFDVEDVRGLPAGHGLGPVGAEPPWPNLAVVVTRPEDDRFCVSAPLDYFAPLELFDFGHLAGRLADGLACACPSR